MGMRRYIISLPTPWSLNNVRIFSDSTVEVNVMISPTQQDLRSKLVEEIKFICNS